MGERFEATPQVAPVLRHGESSYGSDAVGLICGFLFNADGRATAIGSAEAIEWLSARESGHVSGFIWLHFTRSNANAERWLQDHIPLLPAHYFETLHEAPSSTRVELADGSLAAVINDVRYDFSFEAEQIATLWMYVGCHLVVSTRMHPLRSVDRLRIAVRDGEVFESPLSLLVHLLRDQADVLQQIQHMALRRVDELEDAILDGHSAGRRNDLGALRRLFVHLRRLLALEPGAMFRLLSRPPPWVAEADVQELRSATEEFSNVLNDLAAMQERTKLLQEELAAKTNEQTNRSVFLLTMVTVLALPINMAAGMLGMNVGGIPLAQDPNGFWIISALLTAFACAAVWYARSRHRD